METYCILLIANIFLLILLFLFLFCCCFCIESVILYDVYSQALGKAPSIEGHARDSDSKTFLLVPASLLCSSWGRHFWVLDILILKVLDSCQRSQIGFLWSREHLNCSSLWAFSHRIKWTDWVLVCFLERLLLAWGQHRNCLWVRWDQNLHYVDPHWLWLHWKEDRESSVFVLCSHSSPTVHT